MVAITNQLKRPANFRKSEVVSAGFALILALVVLMVARQSSWWPVALGVVVFVELGRLTRARGAHQAHKLLSTAVPIVVGVSCVLIVAVNIRYATQLVTAGLYGLWYWWWQRYGERHVLGHALVSQVMLFEAMFLAAAVWQTPEWCLLGALWLGAFWPVYGWLVARNERSAAVLAAAWGLIVVEVAWVLFLWLFVYAIPGGYLLAPQPALVLSALAYVFGSIYASARSSNLSRSRLVEYLLIGLILIVMVIAGTSWRGSM